MAIKLEDDTEQYLLESIKRFFSAELDQDIGDLKAASVLEYFLREIAPNIYNQAIVDAQAFMQEKALDLGGVRYEPEFDYFKSAKRP
jgi:uncharacterized protein (DUF2164 family)